MQLSKFKNIGIISGVISMGISSYNPYLIKNTLANIDIIIFMLLRYLVPTLLLSTFLAKALRKNLRSIKSDLIIIGLMIAICNLTQILSLKQVLGTWFIVFFACTPVVNIWFVSQSRSIHINIACILAVLGCMFFIINKEINNYPDFKSILFLIISSGSWIMVLLRLRKIQTILSDMEINAFFYTVSFIMALIVFIVTINDYRLPVLNDLNIFIIRDLGIFIFIWLLCPLSSLLFNISIRNAPIFGILSQYLQLVFGLIIGTCIFYEPSHYMQWIGATLIIGALLLSRNFNITPFIFKYPTLVTYYIKRSISRTRETNL